MADKFHSLVEVASQAKATAKKEIKALKATVKHLEDELTAKEKSLCSSNAEIARLKEELCEMQRKVEQFCAAIENEGRKQAAGLFKRPEEIPMPHDEVLQEMNWVGLTELQERLGAWSSGDPKLLPRVKVTRRAGTAPGDDSPRDTSGYAAGSAPPIPSDFESD